MIYSVGFIGDRKYSDSNTNFGKSSPKIKPKTTSANQSNFNAAGWLLGVISVATIAIAAIAGRKGYLGKTVQKFLGGIKKVETAPKSTECQAKKHTENFNDTTEIPKTTKTSKKKKRVHKNITPAILQIKSNVELPADVKGTVEFIQKIHKKIMDEFSVKIDELVPSRMVICSDMSVGGISKLPYYHGTSLSRRIAVRYPDGKPKYLVSLLNNDSKKYIVVEELDHDTGKRISQFRKPALIYSVFHPKNTSKKILSVYFHDDGKTRKALYFRKYDHFGNEVQYEARAYFNPDGTLYMINSDKYDKYSNCSVNMYYNKAGIPSRCYIDKFRRKSEVSILTKLNFDKQGAIINMSKSTVLPRPKYTPPA